MTSWNAAGAAEAEGWGVISRAPVVQVAAVGPQGQPVLRTLHGVVWNRSLCVHGGRRGEKSVFLGAPVVASAHEVIARIPSWMLDPERACPATTFFRSVHLEGVVEEVEDMAEKAAILQALMDRFQPEGQHRPITAEDPLYARSVAGTRVLRLAPTGMSVRVKLGQDKPPAVRHRILEGLWRRGDPGDLDAIQAIQAAAPETPPLFSLPPGLIADVAPQPEAVLPEVIALLQGTYWNHGSTTPAQLAVAHRHSAAWVVLRTATPPQQVVATARAISDRGKWSWIYDVCVAEGLRGQGVGQALLSILMDHPALRGTTMVLRTRDAQSFYEKLGFRDVDTLISARPYIIVQMVRSRPLP